MKIYIGFSSPISKSNLFANLIKWVEKRDYDHCYIRFQEPTTKYMIFQASGFAVNLYNPTIWNMKFYSIKEYEINITQDQAYNLWNFILSNLGIPYSILEDFGILLMKIFKLKNNPFSEGLRAEFCSKLAANVLKLLDIDIPDVPDNIDPSELDSILANKQFPVILNPILT